MATTPTRKTRASAPSASADAPARKKPAAKPAGSSAAAPSRTRKSAATGGDEAPSRSRRTAAGAASPAPATADAAPVRKLRARGPTALAPESEAAPRRRSRTLTTKVEPASPARKLRSKATEVEVPDLPKRHRAKVGEAILSEEGGKKAGKTRKTAGKASSPTPAEQVEQLRQTVLGALEDLKARELLVLDVRPLTSMFDWRIIVTGTSNRHLSSMAEEVAKRAKAIGMPPMYISGDRESDWVLVDLGDIVVDLMSEQARAHYALEKLWSVPAAPPAA